MKFRNCVLNIKIENKYDTKFAFKIIIIWKYIHVFSQIVENPNVRKVVDFNC